jgi:hypothetical protein
MSEVKKMYKNAGVEKQYYYFDSADGNTYTWELNENGNDKHNMCFIGKPKIKDREFTAEKQLKIVKFMLHKGIYYDTDGDSYWFHLTDDVENASYKPLEEAIAEFINFLWQDLTEQERTEIAEILRG